MTSAPVEVSAAAQARESRSSRPRARDGRPLRRLRADRGPAAALEEVQIASLVGLDGRVRVESRPAAVRARHHRALPLARGGYWSSASGTSIEIVRFGTSSETMSPVRTSARWRSPVGGFGHDVQGDGTVP